MRRLFLAGLALSVPLGAYTAAFWNNAGAAGLPVQMLRSLTASEGDGRNARSNRYRILETRNLIFDIKRDPFLGRGFGKEFSVRLGAAEAAESDVKGTLAELKIPLWKYVPHNNVLWIWVKAGIIGFIALWFLVILTVAHGTNLSRGLRTPYFRAVATMVTLVVCMQMVVAFVDNGLVGVQYMVFLGMLLGAMSRLRAIEWQEGRK